MPPRLLFTSRLDSTESSGAQIFYVARASNRLYGPLDFVSKCTKVLSISTPEQPPFPSNEGIQSQLGLTCRTSEDGKVKLVGARDPCKFILSLKW
jgi:hypothetical protein